MKRILTPTRYERRIRTDKPSGPTMLGNRVHRRLVMPLVDSSPDTEPDTVSGRHLRADVLGSVLQNKPFTTYASTWHTAVEIRGGELPALQTFPTGYQALALFSWPDPFTLWGGVTDESGTKLVSAFNQGWVFIPYIDRDYYMWVDTFPGFPVLFDQLYIK